MGLLGNIFGGKSASSQSSQPTQQSLDLTKSRATTIQRLSLRKGLPEGQKFRVAANFDISGSMALRYSNGEVQTVFERLFPFAVAFDDNQEIDLFAFHDKAFTAGQVNITNYADAIKRLIIPLGMGGTSYTPFINMIVNHYKGTKGDPVFVLVLVDGDCGDKASAKAAMIEASKYGIFFQFIGIGNDSMNFLEELDDMPGRTVDNADFVRFNDISKVDDRTMYEALLKEIPSWLTAAKAKNIL